MATQYQRAINVVTTDAGALAGAAAGLGPGAEVYGSKMKQGPYRGGDDVKFGPSDSAAAIVYWARNVARVFINRAATAFLYATAVLSFLAFLTTLSSDTADSRNKRYLCALSVVINMVAVAHYKIIVKIRSYDFGAGAAQGFKDFAVGPFAKWNEFLGIGIEMAVDAVRHSDWLVRRNILTIYPHNSTCTRTLSQTHFGDVLCHDSGFGLSLDCRFEHLLSAIFPFANNALLQRRSGTPVPICLVCCLLLARCPSKVARAIVAFVSIDVIDSVLRGWSGRKKRVRNQNMDMLFAKHCILHSHHDARIVRGSSHR